MYFIYTNKKKSTYLTRSIRNWTVRQPSDDCDQTYYDKCQETVTNVPITEPQLWVLHSNEHYV